MSNNWKHIWSKHQAPESENLDLNFLLAVDGFDTNYGGIQEAAWHQYLHYLATQLKIVKDDSIFEIGCGAGAFLHPFWKKGHRVGGIDYSANLVKTALAAMPKAKIVAGEAIEFQDDEQFDLVVANSVFHYFPSHEYAEIVLSLMLKKSRKCIGIFDVLDIEHQEKAIARRKADLGDAEYEKKYRGLDHLYYHRSWFHNILAQESAKVITESQNIQGYDNSPYRFNVFIYKQ